jgi:hypothetical protein
MAVQCVVPVSIGELVDKFTILTIKLDRVRTPEQRAMVAKELGYLRPLVESHRVDSELALELRRINEALWDVEDQLRCKEGAQSFDDDFIQLARRVYLLNDRRAELKRAINVSVNSCLTEVKVYAGCYHTPTSNGL